MVHVSNSTQSMTAEIHATINTISPLLSEKLLSITSSRQDDVETMRMRTTPWKTFFEDDEERSEESKGKIRRIEGTGMGDADGLGKIERWAEEVVSRCTSGMPEC